MEYHDIIFRREGVKLIRNIFGGEAMRKRFIHMLIYTYSFAATAYLVR